ncbi:MAG: O-antigen ligase family protein [Bacteroidota bacterium]|nr:O-antigen ligase family protein [Bacteroidota bacterium]
MVKWLLKYGAAIFLFNTVLLSIEATYNIGSQIFLGLMVLFSFVLIINPDHTKDILTNKSFSFLLVLNIINLAYWLLFHDLSDSEALKYLLARGVQFSIISVSIFHHYEYYSDKFFTHLVYAIFFIITLGLIFNPYIFSSRYSGIIWNPNALASFTTIGFAVLLLKERDKTNFEKFMLFLFLLISISTGSRGVLVGITLAFVIRYGFSIRNIFYTVLAIITFFLVFNLNFDTSLNRFGAQSLLNDRWNQLYYAFHTFLQKPITGWGLDKYAFIDTRIIPYYLQEVIIGAHNGYLAILVQYGILFSSIIFYIIFSRAYSVLNYFRKTRIGYTAIYSFIIVYTLLAAIYESLMTGINEFHTIMFWLSLAILSYSRISNVVYDED